MHIIVSSLIEKLIQICIRCAMFVGAVFYFFILGSNLAMVLYMICFSQKPEKSESENSAFCILFSYVFEFSSTDVRVLFWVFACLRVGMLGLGRYHLAFVIQSSLFMMGPFLGRHAGMFWLVGFWLLVFVLVVQDFNWAQITNMDLALWPLVACRTIICLVERIHITATDFMLLQHLYFGCVGIKLCWNKL